MKPLDWTYELQVFGTQPKSLPLEDLGELVKRLSDLLGSREHLRFGALRKGSARILTKVLEPARQDVLVQLVKTRLEERSSGKVLKLDEYLSSRGWHGELRNREGSVVLVFPGATKVKKSEPERIVQQADSLVGQVIKIGGRDETVPMTLATADGSFVDVTVRGREMARRFAPHLFGKDLRVSGLTTWKRDTEGHWTCAAMLVDDFEEPDSRPLSELFASLRELPGNGWSDLEDPVAEWKKMRGDE